MKDPVWCDFTSLRYLLCGVVFFYVNTKKQWTRLLLVCYNPQRCSEDSNHSLITYLPPT